MTSSQTLPSRPANAYAVYRHDGQFALLAAAAVAPAKRILTLDGEVHPTPTRESVQIGFQHHIDAPASATLEERMDRFPYLFLNHSCEPNARIVGRDLVALQAIAPGEEVTFDYETNEYDLASPFPCACGARSCRSHIRGYRYLPLEAKAQALHQTASHLIAQDETPS